jgi:hypothetical protein
MSDLSPYCAQERMYCRRISWLNPTQDTSAFRRSSSRRKAPEFLKSRAGELGNFCRRRTRSRKSTDDIPTNSLEAAALEPAWATKARFGPRCSQVPRWSRCSVAAIGARIRPTKSKSGWPSAYRGAQQVSRYSRHPVYSSPFPYKPRARQETVRAAARHSLRGS